MKLAITYTSGAVEELSVTPHDMYWWEKHFDRAFGELDQGSMTQLFYLTFLCSQRARGATDRSEEAFEAWLITIDGVPGATDEVDDSPLSETTSPSTDSPPA